VALALPVLGDHSRHGSEYSVANEYYGLMVVIAIRLLVEHAERDTNIDIGGNEYIVQTISDYQCTNTTNRCSKLMVFQ